MKVFAEGRNKGLVEVHAIARIEDKVAATVWFPKFAGEEYKDGMVNETIDRRAVATRKICRLA